MKRVVIAEAHTLVCQAVAAILKEAGFEVVGETSNFERSVALCQKLRPDLFLLAPCGVNSLKVIPRIRACAPKTKILILHEDAKVIFAAMKQGAHGYVTKREPAENLLAAIRQLAQGGLRRAFSTQSPTLTPRQHQVLRLIALGKTNAQIAQFLKISPKTVDAHRTHLRKKLSVHNTAGLTSYALAYGLVPLA